jgi:hypothetical protein
MKAKKMKSMTSSLLPKGENELERSRRSAVVVNGDGDGNGCDNSSLKESPPGAADASTTVLQ